MYIVSHLSHKYSFQVLMALKLVNMVHIRGCLLPMWATYTYNCHTLRRYLANKTRKRTSEITAEIDRSCSGYIDT